VVTNTAATSDHLVRRPADEGLPQSEQLGA
jgi:hypothetical protein